MKRLKFKLRAAWGVLTSKGFITITQQGDYSIYRKDNITDFDAIRYFTAYSNMIKGGNEALDEAKRILDPEP